MTDERRPDRYERLTAQSRDFMTGTPSLVAGAATVCALLHAKSRTTLGGLLPGGGEDELHVGTCPDAVACQVLRDRGVCAYAVRKGVTVVVPNVGEFAGHIACDARSRSEIVVPMRKDARVVAVLHVDSDRLAQLDANYVAPLQRISDRLWPWL